MVVADVSRSSGTKLRLLTCACHTSCHFAWSHTAGYHGNCCRRVLSAGVWVCKEVRMVAGCKVVKGESRRETSINPIRWCHLELLNSVNIPQVVWLLYPLARSLPASLLSHLLPHLNYFACRNFALYSCRPSDICKPCRFLFFFYASHSLAYFSFFVRRGVTVRFFHSLFTSR